MGKKVKDDVPNPSSVVNRDIIQRLNFLYQASTYLHGISPPEVEDVEPPSNKTQAHPAAAYGGIHGLPYDYSYLDRPKKKEKRLCKRRDNATAQLAKNYIKTMKIIGKRTTVRL